MKTMTKLVSTFAVSLLLAETFAKFLFPRQPKPK